MPPSLELAVHIRDLLRSWSKELGFNFSYSSSKEEHAIILDLITMTANGSEAKAVYYFKLTSMFINFCSRNHQYLDTSTMYAIVYKAWKLSYLEALYYLHCNQDMSKLKLHRSIKNIFIDVRNNINSEDEDLKKLANVHLTHEKHRLDKEIRRYAKAIEKKKKQPA